MPAGIDGYNRASDGSPGEPARGVVAPAGSLRLALPLSGVARSADVHSVDHGGQYRHPQRGNTGHDVEPGEPHPRQHEPSCHGVTVSVRACCVCRIGGRPTLVKRCSSQASGMVIAAETANRRGIDPV